MTPIQKAFGALSVSLEAVHDVSSLVETSRKVEYFIIVSLAMMIYATNTLRLLTDIM
jgi:hypothetical protein